MLMLALAQSTEVQHGVLLDLLPSRFAQYVENVAIPLNFGCYIYHQLCHPSISNHFSLIQKNFQGFFRFCENLISPFHR